MCTHVRYCGDISTPLGEVPVSEVVSGSLAVFTIIIHCVCLEGQSHIVCAHSRRGVK